MTSTFECKATDPIGIFQEFLRIPTVSQTGASSGSYQAAADWLVSRCRDAGLDTQVLCFVPGKPLVLATWRGQDSKLSSILLNSHYDVVPVMQEHWTYPAFGATRTPNGRIYSRGTQDMKCVCIQYLLAIQALKTAGHIPLRDVHLLYVPDEETGGVDGMRPFLESATFRALNLGVAMDEGLANPDNAYSVFYGERTPWFFYVTAAGPTGHGSRFVQDTAVSKLLKVANSAMQFRESQEKTLGHTGGCSHAQAKKLGDVTTLNLTVLSAGVSADGGQTYAMNVIPTEAKAGTQDHVTRNNPRTILSR
jgi:aminoacylase